MIKYKRIILKLSGEALANKDGTILNPEKLNVIAEAVKAMHEEGVEIGIVIGAGNIFRGKISSKIGVDRTNGDYMGMLGTIINCIALSSALEKIGVTTRVMSAVEVNKIAEPYIYKKAIAHLNCNKVVLPVVIGPYTTVIFLSGSVEKSISFKPLYCLKLLIVNLMNFIFCLPTNYI